MAFQMRFGRGILRARGCVALTVACLFVLQAIAIAAGPAHAALDAGLDQSFAYCSANSDANDSSAPAHHVHGEHCLICAAAEIVQPVRAIAFIALAVHAAPARAPLAWRLRDESPPPPSGWTSSWSSRAPPSFS